MKRIILSLMLLASVVAVGQRPVRIVGDSASAYAAAELQPAYQAAMEMSVSNLNILFLFTVNIYKNYNGLLILPALAAITQVIMTKFTQQAQPAQNSGNNAQAAQTQSMNTFMKYLFPLMSIWFCLISSASFAIYWVTSNIVAGISNYAISKYYDNKDQNTASEQGALKA